MAFYAELVRIQWYCVKGFDAIYWYKKKLYDDWYNSLTDEQKQLLEERKKQRAEDDQQRLTNFFMGLTKIYMNLLDVMMPQYPDKYGGAYNWDGTPNEEYFHELSRKRREEQEEAKELEAALSER